MSTATMPPPASPCPNTSPEACAARLARTEAGRNAARLLLAFLRHTAGTVNDNDRWDLIVLMICGIGENERTAAVLDLLQQATAGISIITAGEDGL